MLHVTNINIYENVIIELDDCLIKGPTCIINCEWQCAKYLVTKD